MNIKKLSITFISICLLGTLTLHPTQVNATDFSGKESKYIKLCSSSKLTSKQQKTCKEFNSYLSKKNKELQADTKDTKNEIKETKESIEDISKEITTLENKIASTQEELKYIETSIKKLNNEITEKQELLRERLYSMQTTVNSNFFASVIFGAQDFNDLMRRIISLKEITNYDNQLIEELQNDMNEVEKQKQTLTSMKQTLTSQKAKQDDLKKQFTAKLTEQNKTLADNSSQMSKNQESIEAIQANLAAIQKASDESKVSNVTQATPNKKPTTNNNTNQDKNESSNNSNKDDSNKNDSSQNGSSNESSNENTSTSSNEELGLAIANKALTRQGYMYVWGGGHSLSSIKNPNWTQFDCSGLVNWAHYQCGVNIGTGNTKTLANSGKSVSRSELQAGDIILFSSNGAYSGIHHVGIYIGNNQMVHAPSTGKPVQVANLSYSYWQKEWYSTRRLY